MRFPALVLLALACVSARPMDFVTAEIVDHPMRFKAAEVSAIEAETDAAVEAETEIESETVTQTESVSEVEAELVDSSATHLQVEMVSSDSSEIVEAIDASVGPDLTIPRNGMLAATFGTADVPELKKMDLSSVGKIMETVEGAVKGIKQLPFLVKVVQALRRVLDKIVVESMKDCYVVTFDGIKPEDGTAWDAFHLPKWMTSALNHITIISVCTSPIAVRAIFPTTQVVNDFFTLGAGWVISKTAGTDLVISTRHPFTLTLPSQKLTTLVTGEYTVPKTFQAVGTFPEGAISIRTIAADHGITLPSHLPQPVAAIADTKISKVIVGIKADQPYVVVLAESPTFLTFSKIKIDKVFMGIMWACPPSASSFAEVETSLYASESALTGRPSSKLLRLRQIADRPLRGPIGEYSSQYNQFVRSSFLEAANSHTAKCLTWAIQSKLTIGKLTVPLALFADDKGFYLTLAGAVASGTSTPIPDMDKPLDKVSFTINDLLLTVLGGMNAWPSPIDKAVGWIDKKTGIISTNIDVERLNVWFANSGAVSTQASAGITFLSKKSNVNIFYGPPDKNMRESPAIAVVVKTDLDLIALMQSIMGFSVPYFLSKNIYVAVSTAKLDLSNDNAHLKYLTNDAGGVLQRGVSFNAGLSFNPKSGNALVDKLVKIFPGALNGNVALEETQFKISCTIDRVRLHHRVSFIDTGFSVTSAYAPPSLGLNVQANLEVNITSQLLVFTADFGLTQNTALTSISVGLQMKSTWNDAFGIKGVILDRPGGSVAITLASPPIVTAVSVKGALNIRNYLYGAINVGVDLTDPRKDYFYGEMKEIDMCKIVKAMFGAENTMKIPNVLCEAAKWPAFLIAFAFTKVKTDLQTAELAEILPGIRFRGKVPIPLFWIGVDVRATIPPEKPSLFAKIEVPPLVFEPFLVVSRGETDKVNGPLANVDISPSLSDLNIELKAYVSVLKTINGGVALAITPSKGIEFDAFFLARLGGAGLRVDIGAKLNPLKPLTENGITLKLHLVDLNVLQENIRKVAKAFGGALKAGADKLELAAAKLGKKCEPDAMCEFHCPTSFVEGKSKARSGAEAALSQRVGLLSRRLESSVSALAKMRVAHNTELQALYEKEQRGEGTQFLQTRAQMMLRDEVDLWEQSQIELREEMNAILLGIHEYHDAQALPEAERVAAEAQLATTHATAVEETLARFAEVEEGEDTTTEVAMDVDAIATGTDPNILEKMGDAIAKGIKDAAEDISDGVETVVDWVSKGVKSLKKQFDKLRGKLCEGAVRICQGSCKAAQATVDLAADAVDLTGDAINKLGDWAVALEIRKVGFEILLGNPTGVWLNLEYKFGLKDKEFTTKRIGIQTPKFDKDFSIEFVGKIVWEKIVGDLLKTQATNAGNAIASAIPAPAKTK